MTDSLAPTFLRLHREEHPLLLPNAWDVGSARILVHLGFLAVATTSSGAAAAQGRPDGGLSGDEMLAHAAELAAAVPVPVSADLEHGYADDPEGVARTIERAIGSGLAGASVEDWSGDALYEVDVAADRVRAACEAAGDDLVVTARAENHIRDVDDLDDTIARLRAYQDAGAHVLYAPGLHTLEQVDAVVAAVDRPVNVLLLTGGPSVAELADHGVARISVGGAFAFAAYGALVEVAGQLRAGRVDPALARTGSEAARAAFS